MEAVAVALRAQLVVAEVALRREVENGERRASRRWRIWHGCSRAPRRKLALGTGSAATVASASATIESLILVLDRDRAMLFL